MLTSLWRGGGRSYWGSIPILATWLMMTLNPQKYVLEKGQLIAFRKEQKPLEPCGGSSSLFGRAVHKGEASLCTGENKALTAPASTKAVPPLTQTSSEEEAKGQREGSRQVPKKALPKHTLRRCGTIGTLRRYKTSIQ